MTFYLQATLGAPEDGIMTAELLEMLFMEQTLGGPSLKVGKTPEESNIIVPDKVCFGFKAYMPSRSQIKVIQFDSLFSFLSETFIHCHLSRVL